MKSEIRNEKPVVLVVDDAPANVDVFRKFLMADYKVKVATSGSGAFKAALAAPFPDLILLDVMMPDIDGYQVCKKLKNNVRTRDIPIIFVTSKTNNEDEIKGFNSGAVDFISKPIVPVILKARMKAHLSASKSYHYRQDQQISKSLTNVVDTVGDMISGMTSSSLSNVQAYNESMKTLLEDNSVPDDWSLRLASMLQASLDSRDEADSETLDLPSYNQVRKTVKSVPYFDRGEDLFGKCSENIDVDEMERSIGRVFLQATALKSKDIESTDLDKSARDFISRHMDEVFEINKNNEQQIRTISLERLTPGMILPDGVSTCQGMNIIPPGARLTKSMISYLMQVKSNSSLIEEPIKVVS